MNRSVEFSPNEVFLYFYLLNECNIRGWQNPFEHPNKTIVLATGISEKTVIEVRNRLQQKGLITFESGKKNAKSPVYYLLDESKTVSKEYSISDSFLLFLLFISILLFANTSYSPCISCRDKALYPHLYPLISTYQTYNYRNM